MDGLIPWNEYRSFSLCHLGQGSNLQNITMTRENGLLKIWYGNFFWNEIMRTWCLVSFSNWIIQTSFCCQCRATAFKFFEGVILLTKYQAQFHRIKNSQNISETVSLLSITQNNYKGCIKFGIKNSIDVRTYAKC